jgi:hypothetical protein
MKPSDLDSILKKARTPEPPGEFWEEFPQQVARQLNRPLRETRAAGRNWFPRFAWTAAMVVCVIIAFAIGHWRGRTEMAQRQDLLANAKFVHETLAMFPNQIRALVQDSGGVHVVLADSSNVPSSSPLYVRVCDGKNCSSLVTFSGQEIQVAGQKMTVLSDTQGGIILMGAHFVWASNEKMYSNSRLKIEAKNLDTAAL